MTDEPPLPPNVADCIDVAARFLAAEPPAVQRMLIAHRRGRDGRCVTCAPTVKWPCPMAVVARRAVDHLQ